MSYTFTPLITRLWNREILSQYKSNAMLLAMNKRQCDTCDRHLVADKFWNKTTCRACYTGARQ